MKEAYNFPLHSDEKQEDTKILKSDLKRLKASSDSMQKKTSVEKLRTSEYFNF